MAKRDVPKGFIYDNKTRGAFNPDTGDYLSRRQLEKTRLAQELNIQDANSIFETKRAIRAKNEPIPINQEKIYRGRALGKARQMGLMPTPPPKQPRILPRRLKVHYKGRGKQRIIVQNQDRYRVPHADWNKLITLVNALPPDASISIRVRGRHGYPLGDSPQFTPPCWACRWRRPSATRRHDAGRHRPDRQKRPHRKHLCRPRPGTRQRLSRPQTPPSATPLKLCQAPAAADP